MSDARIEITSGASAGESVQLEGGRAHLIGSSSGATLRLRDKGVFFKHAFLEPGDAGWVLLPALASAKVVVGGEPVERGAGRVLRHGDRLSVGPVELRFVVEAPARGEGEVELLARTRLLEDEVGELRARLRAGPLGLALAEAAAARDEARAAQRRARRADEALAAEVERNTAGAHVRDMVYRGKLERVSEADPAFRLLAEGEARRVALRRERDELNDQLAASRREADAEEARLSAELGELRRRVAQLEQEHAAATEQLAELADEHAFKLEELELARRALEGPAGGGSGA